MIVADSKRINRISSELIAHKLIADRRTTFLASRILPTTRDRSFLTPTSNQVSVHYSYFPNKMAYHEQKEIVSRSWEGIWLDNRT